MADTNPRQLGNALWIIADQLHGAMNAMPTACSSVAVPRVASAPKVPKDGHIDTVIGLTANL